MELVLHGLYLGIFPDLKIRTQGWVSRRDGATLKPDYFTSGAFDEAPSRLDAIDAASPL
jgi:hypothetical protein